MNNIKKIQEKLIEKNLDAVLVTDEKNQRYATGFPFTDGAVIVARSAAWLITDSRYIEAATNTAACCCNVQMFDREHSRLSLIQAALKEAGVDTLILGCTHYPLLEEVISDYMGPDVTLIDSGAEAANLASTQFNPNDGPGGTRYYVSDDPAGFDRLAGLFLQEDVETNAGLVDISRF